MRIAFFNTKPYERAAFDAANPRHGHELHYLEPRLMPPTVNLVNGEPVVCAFVNDSITAEVVGGLCERGVKLLAMRCAGYNNVDLSAAKQHGLTIVRVPAYSPYAVAEHTVAILLTLNRKTHKAYNRVREGNFSIDGLTGFDLHGKTVGVIGTGKIGAIFARIMKGFGCRLLAYDVVPNPEVAALDASYVELSELFASSDIISLHCPLLPTTRHIINESAIARMKPGVTLLNTSRGALIDSKAAIEGLKHGVIGRLGIDVYEEEEGIFFEDVSESGVQDDVLARLLTFPNVLVTGHQAFLTNEALANIAETTLTNVSAFARGEPLVNRVEVK